jgi:hypothetical protein
MNGRHSGEKYPMGKLLTIVDGEVIDRARIMTNGVPEIGVRDSAIMPNKDYRFGRDMKFAMAIRQVEEQMMDRASKIYRPNLYQRMFEGAKNPRIEVRYVEETPHGPERPAA